METGKPEISVTSQQRQRAISRWEDEGGAGSCRQRRSPASSEREAAVPPLANAELVQLRIRVIALENLVIALLAESPDWRLDIAREMASYISPRPGFTPHRLTIRAAAQMIHLVERAGFFRVSETPS
jgi:hypothetical protein